MITRNDIINFEKMCIDNVENFHKKEDQLIVLMEIIDGTNVIGIFSNMLLAKKYAIRRAINDAIISIVDNGSSDDVNDFIGYFDCFIELYLFEQINNLDTDKKIYIVQAGQYKKSKIILGSLKYCLTNDRNEWKRKMCIKLKCDMSKYREHDICKINPIIDKLKFYKLCKIE